MAQLGQLRSEVSMGMHRLKELRLGQAMTQKELAEAAGLNPATLVLVERGYRTPRPATMRKLAAALGVKVTVLTQCGPVPVGKGE